MLTKDVMTAISNGQFDADLENLRAVIDARVKQKSVVDFMQLKIGDRVVLHGLRPQSLNGLMGTLVSPYVSGRKNMRA